ncbi:hypothetical protein Emed_001142 [Eimeria media]
MAVRPELRADSRELEGEKEEAVAAAPLGSKGEEQQRAPSSCKVQEAEEKEREKEREEEREVIVVKDDDDPTSSDSDVTGVCDLKFGRRTQPLRCSRATRYHMLLEVALERKRQRQESKTSSSKTSKSARGEKGREKGRGGGKQHHHHQQKDYCAMLFEKDPFDTSSSDETDADWDPTAVFGEAARRRLKSRRSETESDSEEETDASEEEGEGDDSNNADASSKVEGETHQQADAACSPKKYVKGGVCVTTPEREEGGQQPAEQQQTGSSTSSNQGKKERKSRGLKLNEGQRTTQKNARETKHERHERDSVSASASISSALPPLEITSGRTSTTTSESQEVLAEKKEEQQETGGGRGESEKNRKTRSTALGPHEGTSTKAR